MDMSELMKLSIEDRTDVLERFAARQGLKTAPGVRIETDLLMSALWKFDDQARGDAEAMPRSLWAHYLKAPLLLVRLLELFQPHLLKLDRPLRVLYVGAGHEEVLGTARDGGDCDPEERSWLAARGFHPAGRRRHEPRRLAGF